MTDVRDQTRTAGVQMDDGDNTGRELSPVRGQRLTVQQEREQGRQRLVAAVESRQAEITSFLKPFNTSFDFFVSCLKVALMRTLRDDGEFMTVVTPASFLEATLRCAMNGLLPDGKDAAIARFKDQATLMIMKDGLVKVLHRTGMIKDINSGVVTKREEDGGRFEYEEGSAGYIKHRPMLDRSEEADEVIAAYCIVRTVNGGEYRELVGAADLKKIAKVSRATSGPRKEWPWRMHEKSAIRRIALKLPKDEGLVRVLAHDEDAYDLTLLNVTDRPPAIPKAALFSAKAHARRVEAPAAPQEAPVDGVSDPEATDVPAEVPPAQRLVTALLHAEDLATLLELTDEAQAIECSADEREWINQTAEATRARLMTPADDDGPLGARVAGSPGAEAEPASLASADGTATDAGTHGFGAPTMDEILDGDELPEGLRPPVVLRAVTLSTAGVKEYTDGKAWADALLAKMASVQGDRLHAFWRTNAPFIAEAKGAGVHDAWRVIKQAALRGLGTEA